jgi:RNase adaptor protein for sRNA GlmZ degradation
VYFVTMKQELIKEIDAFIAETGLSEHRVGFLLARNGKLVARLRAGRRIWPETEQMIRDGIARERALRCATKNHSNPPTSAPAKEAS